MRLLKVVPVVAIGVACCLPATASGHHFQKGGWEGITAKQHGEATKHLPQANKDVDVISRLKLKNVSEGKIADVGISPDGNTAFLAAWGHVTCKYNGIHVVDITDPAKPAEKAFIQAQEGSTPGEGVQVIKLTTPFFNGDLLVSNNEKCKPKTGFGGMNLYDVSNPHHPTALAEGVGDSTVHGQGKKAANEIHSVFAWDAGSKGYAVIVDNEEELDVDIMDITNPKKAKLVAEYDLDQMFPQIVQASPINLTQIFHHDMIVKEINGRQIMLISYWDGGYVKLDMTDPLNPTLLGDTDFAAIDPEAAESGLTVPPEGNAHQSEFTRDNKYVVASDEDFGPYALGAHNDTDNTSIQASQGDATRLLLEGETITGTSKYVGQACPGGAPVPAGLGEIAVVERGVCTFTEKVASVIAAGGYKAVLVFNREGGDACNQTTGMTVVGDIPAFGVAPREDGFALFDVEDQYDDTACLAGAGDGSQVLPVPIGTVGDTLTFSSYFDGWGYVHLYRNQGAKLAELDTYAIPEAHDPAYATGFGDLSVHEVAASHVNDNRLYFSYYSGGFRVVDIENDKLVEKGYNIDPEGNNFWGVQVFSHGGQEYVAGSDRDAGLWIFKYTG
jgi:hypothetical protein